MAVCRSNPRLGRIGCGAEYNGELQHSVAKVKWSEHPDGIAHITARASTIEILWNRGGEEMANPADQEDMELNGDGYWVRPMRPEARAWADAKGVERARAKK